MKKLLTASLAVLGTMALAVPIHAQTTSVGVQFYASGATWGALNGPGGLGNVTAGALPQNNWNSYQVGTQTNPGSMIDSTGNTSAVTFQTNSNWGSYPNGATVGAWESWGSPNPPNYYLLLGCANGIYATVDPDTVTLTLGGLNSTDTYDLYVYLESYAAGTGVDSVSLGSATYYYLNNSGPLSLVQTTATSSADAIDANYAVFSGISGAALESGTVTVANVSGFDGHVGVSGFQVVDTGAVPEPSTTWLVALGLFGLVAFRTRSRRFV